MDQIQGQPQQQREREQATADEVQVQEVLDSLPAPQDVDPTSSSHVTLPGPVDIRSFGIAILSTVAVLAALKWASDFFIPLMLGKDTAQIRQARFGAAIGLLARPSFQFLLAHRHP